MLSTILATRKVSEWLAARGENDLNEPKRREAIERLEVRSQRIVVDNA